ncbi:hypothetical protein AN958_09650 [Leucoagaricus sp. SymC.cos]|nr:hypothetical protein AN958_09650 [Leucoagaricus sp. SymC.cos]
MGTLQRQLFNDHPHVIGVGLSGILSIFSMGSTPGMIPIILALTTLLIYSRKIFPTLAPRKKRHTSILWGAITIGSMIPRFTAAKHALSQPALSILSLFLLSGLTSTLSIAALFLETYASSRSAHNYDSVRLLLFPALWATFWTSIAYLSPLGMLSTWSPVEGTGSYDWMLPFFGPESLNWVVAAWAVVASETLMPLYMGSSDEEGSPNHHDDYDPHPGPLIPTTAEPNGTSDPYFTVNDGSRRHVTKKDATALLAMLLVLLTIPSYFISSLPIPLGDVSKATPLAVGCALPTVDEYKVPEFGFKHYLSESKKLDNTANFILWPEGAVRFESEAARNDALEEVRMKVLHAFIGVSFEEILADTENASNRHGIRRTGIAIVSNRSTIPHLLYYKRHLVPSEFLQSHPWYRILLFPKVAESFSLTHATRPPTTFTAEIRYNKNYPVAGHTRNVSVTASICLDYSDPSLFEGLEVRPGLILAPARTWDVTVGYTMWKQASQRAHEIGSTLLWCDGGKGGMSGVAGQGTSEVFQVGSGSWIRTIGVEFPFDGHRTVYAQYGNSALLLFWALVIGAPVGQRGGRLVQRLSERSRRRRTGSSGQPQVPVGSLIDSDN